MVHPRGMGCGELSRDGGPAVLSEDAGVPDTEGVQGLDHDGRVAGHRERLRRVVRHPEAGKVERDASITVGQQVDDRLERARVPGGLMEEDKAGAVAGLPVVDVAVVEGGVPFSNWDHDRPAIPATMAPAATPSAGAWMRLRGTEYRASGPDSPTTYSSSINAAPPASGAMYKA